MAPEDLIDRARKAARFAHAPYSGFHVGAALLLTDGSVIVGTNFENASYGLTLCAEVVALGSANAGGRLREVAEIAVVGKAKDGGGTAVVRPCGRCRQVISEAAQLGGRDIVIHCASADGGGYERHLISDLLPLAFGPADLGIA